MNIRRWIPRISPKWLLVPPILLGLGVLVFAIQNQRTLDRRPPAEEARPLRVTTVNRRDVAPTVVGYGIAAPKRTWRAVAQVDGRVVETHQRLDPGEIIPEGELLVQIDPTDYQLRLQRLEAQSESLSAQIQELEATRENDQALLKIEKEALELSRKDLERNLKLLQRGAIVQASFDAVQREVLIQQRQVQNLQGSLNLIPARLARLQAEQLALQRQIAEAKRDLERTHIEAPFDCRLASVEIEPNQYVGPGETLFEVHGLDAFEVEAQLPLDDLRLLAPSEKSRDLQTVMALLRGMDATIKVRSGEWSRSWPGSIVRIREQVQRRTRTVGVVIRVDTPYRSVRPNNPPLLEGLFCEAELQGQPRRGQLVVPRVAVREGRVYVVNEENRLEVRTLSSAIPVGDLMLVRGELEAGERIILSDPTPAVGGMLVEPISVEEDR